MSDLLIFAGLFLTVSAQAATFVVNSTIDPGDGTCDATCTLRDAITAANATAGNDIINFDASLAEQTITLTGTNLNIANGGTLTINGLGADQLSVSGNNASRVFSIYTGANATINGITVTGGNEPFVGGGIYNGGTLTLNNSTVSGNSASNIGGGIRNARTLTLNNSTVSGNSATNEGGGIYNSGTTTLTNSTVSNNSATSGDGGGIYNFGGGTTTLNNSTISGNSAISGGGINNIGGTTTLNNSIIANSTSGGDCSGSGTVNASYSLIEDASCGVMNGVNNNKTGDPNLGPLQNNGGPTLTHALLPNSIAIDAGSNALIPRGVTTDQRGQARIVDGDSNGTATVDMGSYEALATQPFVVNSTIDPGDGTCDATECTLREAIMAANANAGNDIINFNTSLAGQTITLTGTDLDIANNGTLTINGLGADQLSVSGNNASRVFLINAGANATINGITVTGGNDTNGGGIRNLGILTLNNSTISGNSASSGSGGGGGIDNNNNSGRLTLNNSTVSGNSANNLGGGIRNDGSLTLTNSTVSGNSASNGGGIRNNEFGTTTLNNSTVSGNSASNGGGIRNFGTTTLNNSIIANSTNGGDCSGSGTVNASYSLIEDSLGCVNGMNSNNLTGDPNLGPLQNNGGSTMTHALLTGSIAIDTGNSTLTQDQRGAFRPVDDPNSPNGSGNLADIGAFEVQAPTAASVSVAGKVRTPNGRGLTNAYITLTDSSGKYRLARTTAFGYFRFEDVAPGETYIIQVISKRYRFMPQVLSITQDIADLELTMENIFSRRRVKE